LLRRKVPSSPLLESPQSPICRCGISYRHPIALWLNRLTNSFTPNMIRKSRCGLSFWLVPLPPPSWGYLARKSFYCYRLRVVGVCKIQILNGLLAKYRFQVGYLLPFPFGSSSSICLFFNCIWLEGANRTGEKWRLARVLWWLWLDIFKNRSRAVELGAGHPLGVQDRQRRRTNKGEIQGSFTAFRMTT
jgi:hypothetical protein